MGNQKLVLWIGALALATTSYTAHAADLPEPPVYEQPIIEEVPEVVTHSSGGWYLRGDISYDIVNDFGVTYAGNSFTSAELKDGANIGIGVGYRFSDMFRVDATAEYFWTDFMGSSAGSCAFNAGGVAVPGSCVSNDTAEFDAWSLMANGYFDIGNFHGITPYVGAGVGATYASWGNYSYTQTCTRLPGQVATHSCYQPGNANYVAPGTGAQASTTTGTYVGDESWKFTYALMAGFSYDINHNLKLDAGYKYMNIAGGTLLGNIGGGTQVSHGDLGVHSFRVGLRYQIW